MSLKVLLIKAAVGFVIGFATGAGIDLQELRTYRKREQWAAFDFRVAAARWFSGAAYGALSALGIAGGEAVGIVPSS